MLRAGQRDPHRLIRFRWHKSRLDYLLTYSPYYSTISYTHISLPLQHPNTEQNPQATYPYPNHPITPITKPHSSSSSSSHSHCPHRPNSSSDSPSHSHHHHHHLNSPSLSPSLQPHYSSSSPPHPAAPNPYRSKPAARRRARAAKSPFSSRFARLRRRG